VDLIAIFFCICLLTPGHRQTRLLGRDCRSQPRQCRYSRHRYNPRSHRICHLVATHSRRRLLSGCPWEPATSDIFRGHHIFRWEPVPSVAHPMIPGGPPNSYSGPDMRIICKCFFTCRTSRPERHEIGEGDSERKPHMPLVEIVRAADGPEPSLQAEI
jgi:hypothetical protein